MESIDLLGGSREASVEDKDQGERSSIFGIEPAEIIKAAIATLLVIVVRVVLAVFKLTPQVPEFLKGTVTPEQLTNAIAGVLWLVIVLAIFWSNKWRTRRRHVHGKVGSGKVAIWVAELEGDGKKGEHRTNIVRTLERELAPSVQILRAGIELRVEEAGDAAEEASAANRKAQDYLGRHQGDLLIWGQVLTGTPAVIEVRFTSPAHHGTDAMRFNYDQKFLLTEDFGQELGTALAALAVEQASPAVDEGKYVADVLTPTAQKLARLANNLPASMGPDGRGLLLNSYALVENRIGQQRGDSKALERAISAFSAALNERSRERVPLDWAMTQNNLGNTLSALGQRESGTARLEEAVSVFRAALEERTLDQVPLNWAMTQNNLGVALWALGERESGTEHLKEAASAFRASLGEFRRERVPLRWAMTQNNLGNALCALGERETGTAHLGEAVSAYCAALEEQSRERVPLDWAMTQNNLGTALYLLGQRESGNARLEEAVSAYRAALEERTRDRMPLDWAMTQNNLGAALRTLGQRESGTASLEEAVSAFREALEERRRDRVPLDWAMTQNNLGNALYLLGERESGTARLEEAVSAHREALDEYRRERVPLRWAMAQNNLGKTLRALGERETGTAHLQEALDAITLARDLYREVGMDQYDKYFDSSTNEIAALIASRRHA
jgi:tetratricopeptide (TPR) repeat protein